MITIWGYITELKGREENRTFWGSDVKVDQSQNGLGYLDLRSVSCVSSTLATIWFGWKQHRSLIHGSTCWSKSPRMLSIHGLRQSMLGLSWLQCWFLGSGNGSSGPNQNETTTFFKDGWKKKKSYSSNRWLLRLKSVNEVG